MLCDNRNFLCQPVVRISRKLRDLGHHIPIGPAVLLYLFIVGQQPVHLGIKPGGYLQAGAIQLSLHADDRVGGKRVPLHCPDLLVLIGRNFCRFERRFGCLLGSLGELRQPFLCARQLRCVRGCIRLAAMEQPVLHRPWA